jgi:hypothetical protein
MQHNVRHKEVVKVRQPDDLRDVVVAWVLTRIGFGKLVRYGEDTMKFFSIALVLMAAAFATPNRSEADEICSECPCGILTGGGGCACARPCGGGGPYPKSVPIRNRKQCSTTNLILVCDTSRFTNSACSLRCMRK